MRKLIGVCMLLLFALPLRAEVVVTDAWVREAPPGVRMLAAYMMLRNHATQAVTIIGFSSKAFERVELHQSSKQGGMMRMKKLDRLTLAAGQAVTLSPSATHLMLIKPRRLLREGDRVEFSMQLESGLKSDFFAEVRRFREN